jgi:3-oxoadipate CoA-transferase alpha subunit
VRSADGYTCSRGPLKGDVALIKARAADRWGNHVNSVMAMVAELTVVEVDTMVELGEMDPEALVTPSIFVDRVVLVSVCPGRS